MNTQAESGMARSAARGMTWSSIDSLVSAGVQIFVVSLLARLLTPAEFGVVAGALIFISFGRIVAEFGIGQALVQAPIIKDEHVKAVSSFAILTTTFSAVCISLSAGWISEFFALPQLSSVLPVLVLCIPLRGLSIPGESLLTKRLQFKKLSLLGTLSYSLGYICIGLPLAVAGYGVWALVWANIIESLAYSILVRSKSGVQLSLFTNLSAVKDLLSYGAGSSAASMAAAVADQGAAFVVGKNLGAAELGIYSRAYQLTVLPGKLLGTALGRVLFPTFSAIQGDKVRLRDAYLRCISTVTMVTAPLTVFLFCYAGEIVRIILGARWDDVTKPAQIMCLAVAARTIFRISDALAKTLSIYGRAWRQAAYAICVIIFAYAGLRYGILGVAAGMLLAMLINCCLMLQQCIRLLKISFQQLASAIGPGVFLSGAWIIVIGAVQELGEWAGYGRVTQVFFGVTGCILMGFLLGGTLLRRHLGPLIRVMPTNSFMLRLKDTAERRVKNTA